MRTWLVQARPGEDTGGLETLLRQWAPQAPGGCSIERCLLGTDLAEEVKERRPDVLVLAEPACPAGPWASDVLELGVGLVVATVPGRGEAYLALAAHHPVALVPLPPSAETLGLSILSTRAAARRQASCRGQVAELEQRLADRIVIERAKGALVRRLGVTEEEAYRRLRVLARRQRRQVRDVARALLDAEELLGPAGAEPAAADPETWGPESPVVPSERVP